MFIIQNHITVMKKTILSIVALLTIVLLSSCDLESSDNGKLDGFWHLATVDSLAVQTHADMRDKRIFWSFQHNLLELADRDFVHSPIFMRFELIGTDTLRVNRPRFDNREEGDPEIDYEARLYPFGVNMLDELFVIEKLTRNKMILRSNVLRLFFEKF